MPDDVAVNPETPAVDPAVTPPAAVVAQPAPPAIDYSALTVPEAIKEDGFSQVGTGGDFYAEVVVTLTSAKTTPIFALTYELDLMRMT